MKQIRIWLFIAAIGGFSLASQVQADQPKNVEIICRSLLQKDANFTADDYRSYFDSAFIAKIPFDQLMTIFAELNKDVGNCTKFVVSPQGSSGHFNITLSTQIGFDVSFSLVVNQTSGLFTGLNLNGVNNPAVVINSWNDVGPALTRLDPGGRLGATIKTTDNKTHLAFADDHVFAIGSTFKLYILGALQTSIARGQHTWDEKLAIRDDWKSLPSGTMQNLPAGQQVSVLDYATNMISISDNTAADHLLYFLGRASVQSMLSPMGNSHAPLNIPFMSTLEMFKLKWAIDPTQTLKYITADAATRLQDLLGLSKVDKSAVGTNGVSLGRPTDISTIEWFGSTDDNCNAMFWLASQNSPELRQILSKNTPLVSGVGQPESHWSYVGYKGGSEPGVLSMTFLLESKNGNRGCLSMSWNNDNNLVSEVRLADIMKKTLALAEDQIP